MKKLNRILLIIMLLLLLFSSSSIAEQDGNVIDLDETEKPKKESSIPNFKQEAVDPISAGMPTSEVYDEKINPNYIAKYRKNYELDFITDDAVNINEGINSIANIMMNCQRAITEFMIWLISLALTFDANEIFGNLIVTFINRMEKGFNIIAGVIITCTGFFLLVKLLERKLVNFYTGIVKTIFAITIATLFFVYPSMFLYGINYLSTGLSSVVIQSEEDGSSALPDNIKIANTLWKQYVHEPWALLEFGDKELGNKFAEEVLQLPPGTDERDKKILEIEKSSSLRTEKLATKRVGFLIMYLIPMLLNMAIVMLISVGIIGFQFLTLFIFLIGIFILLVSLWPDASTYVLKKWSMALLSTMLMKMGLIFMLLILVSFNSAINEYSGQNGWIAGLGIQLVIYGMIYIKRLKILEIFNTAKQVFEDPKQAKNVLNTHGSLNRRNTGKNTIAYKILQKSSLGKFKSGIDSTVSNSISNYRRAKKSNENNMKYAVRQEKNSQRKEQIRQHIANEREKSKGYLNKKYIFLKQKADKKAQDQNKEPIYNDFIKQTNFKNGKFNMKDIDSVRERRENAKKYIKERRKRPSPIARKRKTGRNKNED